MGVVGRLALGSVGPLLSKRAKRSTEPVAPTHRPAVKHREFWSATNFYPTCHPRPPFSLSPVPRFLHCCSSTKGHGATSRPPPFPHRSLMTMDDNSSPGGDVSVSDAGFNSSDLNLGAAFGDLDTPLGFADQACKECRRRKSKCNKAIPTCNLCVKYRRHCLYEKHSRTPLTRKWVFRPPFRMSVGEGPPAPMSHSILRPVASHPSPTQPHCVVFYFSAQHSLTSPTGISLRSRRDSRGRSTWCARCVQCCRLICCPGRMPLLVRGPGPRQVTRLLTSARLISPAHLPTPRTTPKVRPT